MTEIAGMVMPKTSDDGKTVVIQTPRIDGLQTWFHGAGDQLSIPGPLKRGDGYKLLVSLTGGDSSSVEISYEEPVWLHDGGILWDNASNWLAGDTFEMYLRMPATVTTESAGIGNCNVVNGVIVPAAGDGYANVDLATAVPVPVADETAPNGYWDVDDLDDTGIITASVTPGTAAYHLLTVEQQPYLMRNMPIVGPKGMFDVDAYELKYIHPRWFIGLSVDKPSAGVGSVAGWLLGFRRHVTVS